MYIQQLRQMYLLGVLTFQTHFTPSQLQICGFLVVFFIFFQSILRIPPFKLRQELKIRYLQSVRILDVPFWSFDFLASLNPSMNFSLLHAFSQKSFIIPPPPPCFKQQRIQPVKNSKYALETDFNRSCSKKSITMRKLFYKNFASLPQVFLGRGGTIMCLFRFSSNVDGNFAFFLI